MTNKEIMEQLVAEIRLDPEMETELQELGEYEDNLIGV